jgi:hypothetical protein
MYSSRRYSVQRHINNIHSGKGNAIPFVEYLVGRRTGHYQPGPKPAFSSANSRLDRMIKVADQIDIKRVVDQSLPPPGDPGYADRAKLLRMILTKRALNEFSDSTCQEICESLESGDKSTNLK